MKLFMQSMPGEHHDYALFSLLVDSTSLHNYWLVHFASSQLNIVYWLLFAGVQFSLFSVTFQTESFVTTNN